MKELKVLNVKNVPDWKYRPSMKYVGRLSGSKKHFGNPFTHRKGTIAQVIVGSRKEAVEAFDDWLDGKAWHDVEPERRQWILDNLYTLKGYDLGCWCAPESCHAESLLKRANKE